MHEQADRLLRPGSGFLTGARAGPSQLESSKKALWPKHSGHPWVPIKVQPICETLKAGVCGEFVLAGTVSTSMEGRDGQGAREVGTIVFCPHPNFRRLPTRHGSPGSVRCRNALVAFRTQVDLSLAHGQSQHAHQQRRCRVRMVGLEGIGAYSQ